MRTLRRIIFGTLLLGVLWWWLVPSVGPRIEDGTILELELAGSYTETAEPTLAARVLGSPGQPFVSLLSELAKAERDDRIEAVILRIQPLQIGWAKAQEIRTAIASLSEHGKRTVAYLEFLALSANLEYFVASAADEVWLAPAARAPVMGLAAQYLFLGGLWEKLGIEIEVERIGRYKSAAESIAGREMSDSAREMANALLDSVDHSFVAGIAESRGLGESTVREAIAAGAVEPDAMKKWGLIEGVMHRDELEAHMGDGEILEGSDYAAVDPLEVNFDPVARFALIYGTGNVVTGEGSVSPDGTPVLASDTVSDAIALAVEDPDIDAIVFRVDSPGGSPLASDIVWRAAELAKEAGKPFIVSMSDVAASGGYYVATGADVVVASPASITGSIGVFTLRPVIGGALDKLDIGYESLVRAPHADLQLSTQPLTAGSRARLKAEVESIYELFLERVSAGRSLSRADVDAVAQGRVWTGEQAAQAGLVDVLGGLRTAVVEGKKQLSLDEDADVTLVLFPPPKTLVEQLNDALLGVRAALSPKLALPAAVSDAQQWLEVLTQGTPVARLPFALRIE
jgi:protease-4